MNITTKPLSLAAILLSLSSILLISCSGTSGDADSVSTSADSAGTGTETTANDGTPVFPEMSFGGEAMHFLTEECTFADTYTSFEIYSAGADGSLINDTVYNRNLIIEEKFDVRITEERLQNASQVARDTILAGDNVYDIVMPYLNKSVSNALLGQYYDLNDVENLHLENSWWDQRANENLKVAGQLYFTTGDISILDNDCTMVMFFNKQLVGEYELPNPYELVEKDTWTLNALFSMSAQMAGDVNGDGKMKAEDDRFGLYAAFNVPHSLYFGTGERIADTDADGNLALVMNNERAAEVIPYILENCLADFCMTHSVGFADSVTAFMEGRLLFVGWALADINSIRDCTFDFGILPYPKYEESQSEYYSLISTSLVPGVSIPITNTEPEKAGLILEAMAYYSVDTLTEAYYETALNNRYIRDEESGDMLDIIFASRTYDFGFINDVGGLGLLIQNMYKGKQTNFVSKYEALESKAKAELDELTKAFAASESLQ